MDEARRVIVRKYGQIFRRAFKARMDADYSDSAHFSAEQARQAVEEVERFAGRMKAYLHDVGALLDLQSD